MIADLATDLTWTAVLAGLYFLPTIIAASRKVANVGSVAVINVLLGWTLIGWVVAMAMAARSVTPRTVSRVCPHCLEPVKVGATACPHCQRDIAVSPSM